jgi:hypothetical protein
MRDMVSISRSHIIAAAALVGVVGGAIGSFYRRMIAGILIGAAVALAVVGIFMWIMFTYVVE